MVGSDNSTIRTSKFTPQTAKANGYKVDNSTQYPEFENENPTVFYKTNDKDNSVHTIITDAENNIVRDVYSKQEKLYNEAGGLNDVVFNFANGKLSSIRLQNEESKVIGTIDNPTGQSYRVEDYEQFLTDFLNSSEYSKDNPITVPAEESAITIQSANEIKQELKAERESISEQIKKELEVKFKQFKDRIGLTKDDKREKQSQLRRDLADESFIKWMYADTKFSDNTIEEIFADEAVKYLPVYYERMVGILGRVGNEVVFKQAVEEGQKSKEYIIGSVTSTETLSDLGVMTLSDMPLEFEILDDSRTYNIQGNYYTNNFESLTDAIQYDTDGNVESVVLWNSEGDKISIENPFIAHNLAYAIELQDAVEAEVFDGYFKDKDDFVIFPHKFKNYAVYRKPDGKFAIYDVEEERFVHKKRYTDVKNAFLTEMWGAVKEASYSKISRNNKSRKEVQDEIRRIAATIRSATAREASRIPDEQEAPNPQESQETAQKSKREKELEQELEDALAEEAALNKQAEEEREKQIEETSKREVEEDAKEISATEEVIGESEEIETATEGTLQIPKHGIKAVSYTHLTLPTNREV